MEMRVIYCMHVAVHAAYIAFSGAAPWSRGAGFHSHPLHSPAWIHARSQSHALSKHEAYIWSWPNGGRA